MAETSSIAPALLVAMPQLLDPNFRRAVVLLVHHDAEGTFGLVLNRLADLSVGDLCESLDIEWSGEEEEPLSWGGPVQPNTGWVLFSDGALASEEEESSAVSPGLHVAGSLETLRRIAQHPPARLRLLLGYAGWGPGQLEDELAQGAWLLAPVDPDIVFEVEPESMWERVVRGLGVDPTTLVATPGVH